MKSICFCAMIAIIMFVGCPVINAAAIHDAVESGQLEAVQRELDSGADVNAKFGKTEMTPLGMAMMYRFKDIVNLLLDSPKINVNEQHWMILTPRSFGYLTALMWAVREGDMALVKRLLKFPGIKVDAKSKDGFTALMIAEGCGYKDIAELLRQASVA